MTDEDIERIAEAVARKLERAQQRAPAGYWSLADVAAYLQRSPSAVRAMVYEGTFPRPDLGGGKGSKMAWRPETVKAYRPVRVWRM